MASVSNRRKAAGGTFCAYMINRADMQIMAADAHNTIPLESKMCFWMSQKFIAKHYTS